MSNIKENLTRTWCKYGDCSLEKLEIELNGLDDLWVGLENNWSNPKDLEDIYRIYPLLDTVSALSRKRLIVNGTKNSNYKVNVVIPTNNKKVKTANYLFSDEHKFFNGQYKQKLLADVVSTFLHASEYVYMDTRKKIGGSNFKIYVFVRTDKLCPSCANANLEKININKLNYRTTASFIQYEDCICGQYVELRSFINAIKCLLNDTIDNRR